MASGIVAGTARGRGAGIGQRAIRAAKDRLNRLRYSRRVNFDRVNFDPNSDRLANPLGRRACWSVGWCAITATIAT
jgi:hypothetical protein